MDRRVNASSAVAAARGTPAQAGLGRDRAVLKSVERAVGVLDLLAESRSPLSVHDLARSAALDRTVVHRLLKTLEASHLVQRRESGYALGSRTLLYGTTYLDRLAIRRIALPYMSDIQSNTLPGHPWGVGLGAPTDRYAVLVERLSSDAAPLDIVLDIGSRLSFDRSSLGRAMLAYWDDARVVHFCGQARAEELRPRLRQIRDAGGLEISTSEFRPGVASLAAAILRNGHEPLGAINIFGLKLSEQLSRDSGLAHLLRRVADQIAAVLDSQ